MLWLPCVRAVTEFSICETLGEQMGNYAHCFSLFILSFYFYFIFFFYLFSFYSFLSLFFFSFFFSFLFSFVFSFCFSLLRFKTAHVTSDTKMRRVSQPSASEFIIVWNIQRLQQYPPNIKLVVPIQWTDCCGIPALLSFLFLFLCSSHINV